jgi:flavin-dependent dehydrogenase
LLADSFFQSKVITREPKVKQKPIPLGVLPRTYGDRVLVIGDAAGQVKPTTGGGIYFGHLGAQMATEVLHQALASDDLSAARLSHYEKEWKAKIGREISLGYWARRLYAKLSDQHIEQIFHIVASDGVAESLLKSPDFSFDWHSQLILTALKHGLARHLNKILPFPREFRVES